MDLFSLRADRREPVHDTRCGRARPSMVEKRQILRAQRACQANGVIEPAVADSMGGEANHAVSKTL